MTETGASATFLVEHDDATAGLRKRFTLSYWDADNSLQMFDIQHKRVFLKRTVPPERVKLSSFFIGATVVICARPLAVVDYGDDATRRRYAAVRGSALLLIKPDAYHAAGKITSMVESAGMSIGQLRMVRFDAGQAHDFLATSIVAAPATAASTDASIAHISSDHMLALEVTGDDVIAALHELVGPADPRDATELAPASVRAIFGVDRVRNAVHVSRDASLAKKEIEFVFERKLPHPGVYTHCAVCLVKPHAVASKALGPIMDAVLAAGLEVSAARSLVLAGSDATDFIEAYRGVCPEYDRWVVELSSGPAVAFEVRGEDAVAALRELAGPYDPEIARALRPGSLRARFGVNGVKNAVHVTDLERDGPLESKFLFVVLP